MKTNNDRNKLIRKLLSDKLDEKGKQELSQLDIIEEEMKKQWNESDKKLIEAEIGKQIWNKIERKCEKSRPFRLVHLELWYYVAASVILLFTVGGFWMYFGLGISETERCIEITAHENKLYLLPDSSKVWMQPGSSIRFAEDFNNDRRVWLKGNSLFEVYKHKESTFKVYINKAFIEVKGTCFLIKQNQLDKSEITLFNGNIEFNIEQTGGKVMMKPLQEIIYNPQNAETQIKEIENFDWQNGKYHFKGIGLLKFIQIINQMYSANIMIGEKVNKECAFTGSIRYDESLNDVIEKLCFSLNLQVEKKEGNFIIYN